MILALTLLVGAAAAIGVGLDESLRAARRVSLQAEAADLAVTLSSELQMGLVEPADAGPTPYDEPQEDWTWQIFTEPLENLPTLRRVELAIVHVPSGVSYRLTQWLPAQATDDAGYSGDAFVDEPAAPAPAGGGG